MNCPVCSGPTWDNSEKVASGWKGPIRKCRDKDCSWVQWPPKGPKTAPTGSQRPLQGPKWTWTTLGKTYENSLLLAELRVLASADRMKLKATVDDVLKGAHSVFIEACKSGVAEPKAKLPKPEPKPVPDDEPEPWEERQ